MRFQPGAVEFGEVAFEIVGNLKTFDLPCAVFQRQNREMGMAADSIKRKPKGTGIQVCFFGIFSLLLLVAVPAEQDCGIEIFQMGQQKLRMQTEIPTGRSVLYYRSIFMLSCKSISIFRERKFLIWD